MKNESFSAIHLQPSSFVRFFMERGLMQQPRSALINGLPCVASRLPLKRLFDLFFSVSVMVLFSPVFFFIGVAIAMTSKGQVIFSHERVGRAGVPFQCFKFRSMYLDADRRLKELLERDAVSRREWEATHKLRNDPRITPLGRFLRKSSLDELPQFWNVLIGDLSVVGPRPVQAVEIERHFGDAAPKILSIRPGLTGIWQTSGRSNTTYRERVALDLRYLKERTFWGDLKLIIKTVPAMLFPKGAY